MMTTCIFTPVHLHHFQATVGNVLFPSAFSIAIHSSVFTCIGALGTPSPTGPLPRKYLPGFPYS